MQTLLHQRCFNHALREAAARCPECGRFFCRECVTPHQGRVICAACLSRLGEMRRGPGTIFHAVLRMVQCLAGLAAAWMLFYLAGRILLGLPDSFHEGTFWKAANERAGLEAGRTQRPPASKRAGKDD